ncbi:hypothetical protein HPB47_012291 [Ixodes persulcatus]|uniref:Uncharacterized protein n=1 Tax=Ixodes persulcatus TaxID=34615 RepID=A0AC60NTX0_IXOPE|nr:hypothetical protein HPB47_012291 [Ixodes persulcatus]
MSFSTRRWLKDVVGCCSKLHWRRVRSKHTYALFYVRPPSRRGSLDLSDHVVRRDVDMTLTTRDQWDDWKRVRSVLNPSFSASKMKLLMPIMSTCADVTLQVIDASARTGEVVDVTKLSKGLSMDVITKCALAWQVRRNKAIM